MNFILSSVIIVLYLELCSAFLRINLSQREKGTTRHRRPTSSNGADKDDDPLLLTPLLKVGKIAEARCYSAVHDLVLNLTSNAGFFTVNETYNSNLYFWFFPKVGADWKQAPVILWLQGGPGCSSLFGLFAENGPLMATSSGFRKRKYSWTKDYNMLYIDQPVGTGFSFTDDRRGYIRTQEQVGEHLYEAMIQFFQLYPELRENEFYISGESYAGKYIPSLAYTIHRKTPTAKNPINLKGMLIGNGFTDPWSLLQYAEYTHRLGLIDYSTKTELQKIEEKIRTLIQSRAWSVAASTWEQLMNCLAAAMRCRSFYDYTHERFFDDKYVSRITQDNIRKLIHVGQRKFEDCSDQVWEDFQDDFMQSMKPTVEELLEHYPIMYYSGQLDVIVAYPLTENMFQNLQWSGAEEYSIVKRKVWQVGEHVAGYYKSSGNFTDVLVRNAGHMVPSNQPRYSLDLVKKFINDKW